MHHGPGFAALAWGAEMIVVMSLIVASPCLGREGARARRCHGRLARDERRRQARGAVHGAEFEKWAKVAGAPSH